MDVQYGDACLLLQQVYEWTRTLMNGISSVPDSPRHGARVAALSAIIIFFLELFMHFRSAGTLVWKTMETTWKNEVTVYLLCSINCEIKNI